MIDVRALATKSAKKHHKQRGLHRRIWANNTSQAKPNRIQQKITNTTKREWTKLNEQEIVSACELWIARGVRGL